MEPDSGFVEANGIRLHYLTWHPGSGGHMGFPAVLLLHANGFLARLWQPVAQRLATRYHVFAYDTRGHGDSETPDAADADNYHWRHIAEDARAFLDAFALRDIAVVGHSSGGAAAAYVAGTDPKYFSKLALIEPIILPPELAAGREPPNAMAEAARRRREVWSSPDEMFQAYRKRPTFERWREDVLRLYTEEGTFRREDGQYQLKCPGEVEARMFEHSASLDVWSVLEQVRCPALVIKGQHSDAFLAQIVERVSKRVPNARTETIEGAAHLVPMEQPEALSELILEFLG